MIENLENEIWKDVVEYEGYYQISNLGRVKGLLRKVNTWYGERTVNEKIMKSQLNSWGYLRVILHTTKPTTCMVHRLVAYAFIPKIKGKNYVDHINGIRTDNRLCNLRWCTTRENNTFDNKKYVTPKSSKYIGVSKNGNYWAAKIHIKGEGIHLGTFETEELASEVYQKSLKDYLSQ